VSQPTVAQLEERMSDGTDTQPPPPPQKKRKSEPGESTKTMESISKHASSGIDTEARDFLVDKCGSVAANEKLFLAFMVIDRHDDGSSYGYFCKRDDPSVTLARNALYLAREQGDEEHVWLSLHICFQQEYVDETQAHLCMYGIAKPQDVDWSGWVRDELTAPMPNRYCEVFVVRQD